MEGWTEAGKPVGKGDSLMATMTIDLDTTIPPIVSEKAWDPYVDVIWPRSGVRGIIRRIRRWFGLPTIKWGTR